MAIDAQRLVGFADEGVEVLVARERPGLLVEALDQPVEELAHGQKLSPAQERNSLDFQWIVRIERATNSYIC